jgi:hypothetical protein
VSEPTKDPRELLKEAQARLVEARKQGPAAEADAAVTVFSLAMAAGDAGQAVKALDVAYDASTRARRPDQQCMVLTWRATLARARGQLEVAERYARRAVRLATEDAKLPPAVRRKAHVEGAETALLRGLLGEADDQLARALAVPDLKASEACVLLDRRAGIARMQDRGSDARALLAQATERAREAGNVGDERYGRFSEASLRLIEGNHREALQLIEPLLAEISADSDQRLLAGVYIMRAGCRHALSGPSSALNDALAAREAALRTVDPLAYFQASILIAGLYEEEGNRLRALEAVLTGRATLGDLLGKKVAADLFAKYHDGMKARWGKAYDEVSDTFIRNRRAKSVN